MQASVTQAIKDGHDNAVAGQWDGWTPIKPVDHPNQTLLVPDQTQFVVTRQINRRNWGSVRFAIPATSGPEAGRIADAFCGAINSEKPSKDDKTLINEARKALI